MNINDGLAVVEQWSTHEPTLFARDSSSGPNFEFDLMRHLDDALWMAAILDKSVFQCLGAADKKTTKGATLFPRNPITAPVPANKDNRRCRATRRRLQI
ncbi:hypothetical protein IVB44_30075 [Bradyrhizobium sp. 49]|uniref:hypothetical protein n=1 Tax=unclassified Bradyrhizobium TaxID=2631580 RepID=UPI003211DBE5|nr:hypothetical protein [Bradyrhizobium sp. 84]MCK1375135.1 hypothetical protein [Bradyrhizobium sp. 49]